MDKLLNIVKEKPLHTLFLTVFIVFIICLITTFNKSVLDFNMIMVVFSLLIVLIIGGFVYRDTFFEIEIVKRGLNETLIKSGILIAISLAVFFTIYLIVSNLTGSPVNFVNILSGVLTFALVIAGLGLALKFMGMWKKIPEYLRKFVNILSCGLLAIVDMIYVQVQNTPTSLYKVLLAEIVVIGGYILLRKGGLLIRKIMLANSSVNDKTSIAGKYRERIRQNNLQLKEIENDLKKLKKIDIADKGRDTDELWEEIIKNGLHKMVKVDSLKNFLNDSGFRKSYQCDNIIDSNESIQCNSELEEAIKKVQKNGDLITKYKTDMLEINKENEELNKKLNDVNISDKGIILLGDPVHLNNKRVLSDYDKVRDVAYISDMPMYNYGLSMWVYIHSQGKNFKKTSQRFNTIFNYNNKPKIEYDLDKNILRFSLANGDNYYDRIKFDVKNIKLQKWNNIVVNYVNGIYDIFINTELVNSFSGVVAYMTNDAMEIGERAGLSGAICNVIYYPSYITKSKMERDYKLLKNKKPPVI